ncbi:MAG TPA: cytochrome c peroxidase, partial [Geobacteraceae bacterium]
DFQASPVLRDSNDVVGSQGVVRTDFAGIVLGSAVDDGVPVADQVFFVGPAPNLDPVNNMRRVTARNTPSNINAIFNFNNFWDGRAHFIFNGVNPFGPLDQSAGVWFNQNGALVKQQIAIEFASLASQATGPPLDDTEMSFKGRTFPQLGRKMLSLTPLGKQLVHPNDSVLGPLSRAVLQANGQTTGANGLNASYSQLIRDAFQDNLWNSNLLTPDGFTQLEANFSLFWGLAIQLYEATLVSDNTPFDRFLGGDRTALTSQQQDGFNIFFGAGNCAACHISTELTSASVRAAAFVTNAANALIEPMPVASGQQIIYDNGFNNTSTRPTTDDIGRGGNSPFTNPLTGQPFPLSFSLLAELQAVGNLPFSTPILPPQLPPNFPVANDGNFKVPGLRNIELTAPYFHNGGDMTLKDVVDFYTRGGNFPVANAASLDVAITQIGALQNNTTAQDALIAFMMSMTDERVRNESAPFDHPALVIPNGAPDFISIPARDANGNAASTLAVTIDQLVTPYNKKSQTIGGTMEPGSTVQVSVNNGPPTPATAVTSASWSATVTGFAEGPNTVTATATDGVGNVTSVSGTIFVDTIPPALTVDPVTSPTGSTSQTIAGTVEAGVIPLVLVSTSAVVGPVTAVGTSWSVTVTGLVGGANNFTVIAADQFGNVAVTPPVSIFLGVADGDLNGTGGADVNDALRSLQIAALLIQPPTANDMLHGDVAPLSVNKIPTQNGRIDVADSLLILQKAVGLITF